MSMKDSVCRECAESMGYAPLNKVVGVWRGECDFCGKVKSLTSLQNDWVKKLEVK